MDKKLARLKRALRLRTKIKKLSRSQELVRLCVHKTPRHIYAQLIDSFGNVLAVASTLDKEIKAEIKHGGNIEAAAKVGKQIASKMIQAGIDKPVVFDRSGFKYHGRIKTLAEAAREGGISF